MKKKSSEEDISCLVDGELGQFRSRVALTRIQSSPEVRKRWEHYCMIGDVLRRVPALSSDEHFADEIAEHLRSEPTVLAPARWRRGMAGGAYWGGGLAVAASVMAFAVFVYQDDGLSPIPGATEVATATGQVAVPQGNLSLDRDVGIQAIRPIPAAETGQGAVRYAGLRTDSLAQVRATRPVYYWESQPGARDKYNSYLVKHNQHASRHGGAGFVNYARLVSADHAPVREQQTDVR